ncbi:Cadherin-23 [Eumeta japonica]|uniref:Cadherin-23 n=1 Tax=Eumeta variegata TaxID=151549 RepID=A0A4C1VGI2_EUMVA|nr:Cadherin-23 [Eumeta japonica]
MLLRVCSEKRSAPRVRLKSNNGRIERSSWLLLAVILVVQTSANRPPRFLIDGQTEIVIRLKEGPDTPPGSLIYRLKGVDPDGDTLKFGIREQIGSDILRLEAISSNEANIYLVKELDREASEGNFVTQSFLLLVEDVNDNEPIFKPYPSAVTVKEDAPPGILATVEATDLDEGAYGQVLYHLQELDGDVENFAIQTVNGKGVVRLTNQLDYERKALYQLRILAVDRANQGRINTGTAAILVKVQDIEDQPPVFVAVSPVTRISEDAPVGTSVLQVRAIDGDRGINNRISYSIISGGEDHFDIDSSSGIIYTINPLDREDPQNSNGAYILEILATEESRTVSPHPSTNTEVTIIVTDVNDETPQFRSERYIGEVLENAQQNTPITFLQDAIPEVFDYDQGKNGTFELFLDGDSGVFDVTPYRGINEASFLIRVNDASYLDYESVTVMNFTLVAKETVSKDPKLRLYLHPVSGVITVKQPGGDSFDRELISSHYLTVEARDDLGKGNRNTAQLIINIEDVNDNAPIFLANKYEARLLENEEQFEHPLMLEARDIDLNGTKNSHIEYSIIGGEYKNNFSIDPNLGIITPVGQLDFEQIPGDNSNIRPIHLTIKARDFGSPSLSSTVPVTIYVQDVNDHVPMFTQMVYKRSIPEDMAGGTSVLEVKARDADGSSPNNRVVYRIQRGASDKFVIDSITGIISVAKGSSLDPDKTNPKSKRYTLTVVALDGGIGDQQLTAAVLVNITIVDVNNKPPVFFEPGTITVKENIQVGTVIYHVEAHDPDEQPVLRYHIDRESSVAKNEEGILVKLSEYDYLSLWDLNAVDGTLRVVRLIDREKIETIKLVVIVEDMAAIDVGPRQTASATLTIMVEDENDNNPKFRKPFYKCSITENSKTGVNIATVIADDADKNRSMSYYFEGPEEITNLIHIESQTGEVVVAAKIDHEIYPWINLTVKAVDSGVPPRYSLVDLYVQVLDENDNNPYFEPGPVEYKIKENVEPGTAVARILAKDADSGEYGKITYLLDRISTQGKFLINAETGTLTVSDLLDRETQTFYNLVIEAWDNYQFGYLSGESRNAFKQILIHVQDVNDNAPELHLPVDCATITEFHNWREPITSLRATDRDDNATPNGRVQFHIVGGKGHEMFRFEQVGGDANTGRLFARHSLRDRYGNYTLVVEARDLGVPANIARGELRVCVTDYNDHAPVFVHPPQNVTIKVPENATIGTTVVEVRAIDADIGANGAVRYRLRQDAAGGWRAFSVHAGSGAVRTAARLDRDKQRAYQLRIEAYDLGIPTPLSSDLDLTIYVQNVDGYKPHFPEKKITFNMTENMRPEESSVYLPSVIERDEIDRGDEPLLPVCYYIVKGNENEVFELQKDTHRLTPFKPLDREMIEEYSLLILATEDCAFRPSYKPETDSASTLQTIIKVLDVNDNPPKFVSSIFTGGITTEADFGLEFMHVKAIDPDQGENSKVTYYLIGEVKRTLTEGLENLAVSPFLVDKDTGAVTLNFDPQKGMKGYFDFRLAVVTGAVVNVDDLRVHENKDGSVDNTKTDLYMHLVNGNDHSVMEVDQVLQLIDKNIEQLDDLFKEFNVLDTQAAEYQPLTAETLGSNQTVFWLVWTTLFLGVLLILSLMVCLSQRADYARRLKAANATAYATSTPGESDMTIRSSGGRVPNTNKHSTKGSNPIWLHAYENDWYKSEDQLSRSERDSLDENAVDQDPSNEKPYYITTAAFPSIESTETEPQNNHSKYSYYQQLEQVKNVKNMETTEL